MLAGMVTVYPQLVQSKYTTVPCDHPRERQEPNTARIVSLDTGREEPSVYSDMGS